MNKKIIPIIIIIAVVFLGLGVYLFFTLNPARKENLNNTVQNLFPFGQPQQTTETGGQIIPSEEGGQQIPGTTIETNVPAFRQISTVPINAYRALVSQEMKEMPRTIIGANGEATTTSELRPVTVYSVRFGSVDNGAIYQATIGDTIVTSQLTDSDIPAIDHALFNLDGSTLVMQYSDGSFGNETIRTYFSNITKTPLVVDPCPFAFPVNLKFQDKNDAVANIQRFLNGYLGIIISETGENSPGSETGIYDALTKAAVQKFQTTHNLTADGNIGPKTRQAFLDACMVIQNQKAQERYQQSNQFLYRTSGLFGADNIIDIKNIDAQNVFYVIKNQTKTFGIIYNLATKGARQVFDSSFSEWLTQPLSQEKIIFTTKASGEARGYSYELDTTKNTFTKITGDLVGLTTLASPNGKLVVLGATTQGSYELLLRNRENNTTKPLGIKTFPEKCVWNTDSTVVYCAVPDSLPTGTYPDALYQGIITTQDTLWSINAVTGATQKLHDPKEEVNRGMMLTDLQVTSDGRYLFTKNSNDNTLWVLNLLQ